MMDKALIDRHLFIGGSEANMIYANYKSKTFIKWWEHKITGLPTKKNNNLNMSVGTILEKEILDLYESIHDVKGERDLQENKGFARASTDYILNKTVYDVKASKNAFEWFLKERIPIQYKRQLIHYMYVFNLNKAGLIAYQVNEETLNYPFDNLTRNKLFEIPVKVTEEEIKTHEDKLNYLEYCKELNIYPEVIK